MKMKFNFRRLLSGQWENSGGTGKILPGGERQFLPVSHKNLDFTGDFQPVKIFSDMARALLKGGLE